MSALQRKSNVATIVADDWDLIVIGGGITGAGIILDAAGQGMKALLLEKNDFAWGTSSRSTKLIHGGLRYLKQMEIGLVREVGKERAIVYKNARHIVRPEKMLLPIVEGGALGKITSSIGLWVYDWLADVEKGERRIMLTKEETLAQEKLLNESILRGGGLYYEYRTDDARLTIEIIKKAVELGAAAINYAEVTRFLYDKEMITGVMFTDHLDGREKEVRSKSVVNASGPWVDKVRRIDDPEISGKRLHLTKGSHLVVEKSRFPIQQSVYIDVPEDERMIFCIPREKVVYMGTTDTNYEEKIDRPRTTRKDVDYILKAVNNMFPTIHLTIKDIVSSWAGLRPLIHEDGKDPSELSRKDEIFISKSGLISIAGGKLTGYRMMSERTLEAVIKQNSQLSKKLDQGSGESKNLKVAGNIYNSEEEMTAAKAEMGEKFKIEKSALDRLFSKYGSNTEEVLKMSRQFQSKGADEKTALIKGEIHYVVKNEMAHHLSDFCIRRSSMLYFDPESMLENLDLFSSEMAILLDWTEEERIQQMQMIKLAHQASVTFD